MQQLCIPPHGESRKPSQGFGGIKGKNHGHQDWQVKEYQTDGHIKSLKKACFFLHDILLFSFFLVHPLHQTHGDQNNHRQNHGNGTSEIPVSN